MTGGASDVRCEENFSLLDVDPPRNDLWKVISQRARSYDLAALSVVPALIVLIYMLPSWLKQDLVLNYNDPTIVTAYTSHFVHFSTTHLGVNVLGYMLVVSLAYFLAVASANREQFWSVYLIFILSFPFALSGMNLLWQWDGVGFGFSGLLMAFVGYLPIVLLQFVGTRFDQPVNQRQSIWLFLISVAVAAYISLPLVYSVPLVFAATAVTSVFLWRTIRHLHRDSLDGLRRGLNVPGNAEFTILGVLVVVLYPFITFSPDILMENGILNVYTHGLGLCFGFIIAYLGIRSD